MMSKRCRIFISYAHADEEAARSDYPKGVGYPSAFLRHFKSSLPVLRGQLSEEEIFFDTRRLAAEPAWDEAIRQALSDCELFIFLVSPFSLGSPYCMTEELGRAAKRGVPVITVLLEPRDDWIECPVYDPDDKSGSASGRIELKKLGAFHAGGLPKDASGNALAVSQWSDEAEAWSAVWRDIKQFLTGPNFNQAAIREATLAPDLDPAPDAGTELQRMLAAQLNEHWKTLARSPIFTGAKVFQDLSQPLSARKVFDACAVDASPLTLLARLRGFVGKEADGSRAAARLAGQPEVLETVLRLTLVAAERYIASKAGSLGVLRDEAVVDADPRVSAVLAAACFGFGIRLRASSPVPENFIRPAADEFGYEQGSRNIKRDLRAAADRFTLESPPQQISDEDVEDEEFLQALLDEVRDTLGCRLVLLCPEQSPLRQPANRASMLGSLDVPVVFEGVPRDEVRSLLGSLRSAVSALLEGLLGSPSTVQSPSSGT